MDFKILCVLCKHKVDLNYVKFDPQGLGSQMKACHWTQKSNQGRTVGETGMITPKPSGLLRNKNNNDKILDSYFEFCD